MKSAEAKSTFELNLGCDRKHPNLPDQAGSHPLEVNVLCAEMPTTAGAMPVTVRAMESAVALARGLNAQIHMLMAQEVSYAVPLESPPVLVEFQEELFRRMAETCGVPTRVDIFLCRDAGETLSQHLSPHSVVVLGARKRWWPTREEKLARRLRRLGHEVAIVYMKGNTHHA